MKKTVFLGALTIAGLAAGLVSAGTLDDVKARGKLNCGVTTGVPGFAEPDANGVWHLLISFRRCGMVRKRSRVSIPDYDQFSNNKL